MPQPNVARKRYAICGLSTRSVVNFLLPLLGIPSSFGELDFSGSGEVVGVVDPDPERISEMNRKCGTSIPGFSDLATLICKTQPEVILLGSPDRFHAEGIITALEHGLDVIVEKPMVITAAQARAILEAEKQSKGRVRVAFNMRYHPATIAAKRFIAGGGLGTITNVEFAFNIDTQHGSSYFYRWNRERANSGGLSIHKGTHHFDVVSWLIDDRPETVFAFGKRNFYGPEGLLRPRSEQGKPLTSEEERALCPYYRRHLSTQFGVGENPATGWDPLGLPYHQQYPENERRYIYDEAIDIEDTYSAVIRYQKGTSLSYSCTFSAAWSGLRLAINGSKGRLEYVQTNRTFAPQNEMTPPPLHNELTFYPLFGGRETLQIPSIGGGGHGGADELIQDDMFNEGRRNPALAELGCYSGAIDGAYAVATGEAVWRSAKEGRAITIQEMLGELPIKA